MTVNELLNAIKKKPLLTRLTILNDFDTNINLNCDDLMRLSREHPYIVELDLSTQQIALQDAVTFFYQLKSLKKFQFQINDEADYDELVRAISNGQRMET